MNWTLQIQYHDGTTSPIFGGDSPRSAVVAMKMAVEFPQTPTFDETISDFMRNYARRVWLVRREAVESADCELFLRSLHKAGAIILTTPDDQEIIE